jgi:uncharacterized protein
VPVSWVERTAPALRCPVVPDAPQTETERDTERITDLLGRAPRGGFEVVVREPDGEPVVIRNEPLLTDGTPMPTRYWLVDRHRSRLVGALESEGGVRRAEAETDPGELAGAHLRYAVERDADVPDSWTGPRPSGGVGGTRQGVKCLHAHYAWFLAGGDDPVGRWVHERVADRAGPGPVAPPAGAAPS